MRGMGENNYTSNMQLTVTNTLNYIDTFNEKHHLNVLLGQEGQKTHQKVAYLAGSNYPVEGLNDVSLSSVPGSAATYQYELVLASFFANAQYDYDNKYYLSGSFRRDGSSRLGADNRWANFWSVSAAWRLSGENFLQDNPLFSDLKLRFSYGTNGNLPSDYYAHQALYAFSGGYGPNSAIYWNQAGNEMLGWEKSKNMNIGIDWSLFHRVNLTVEYYNKTTTDLLFEVPTSVVTGFESNWENLGKLRNSGVEIEINSQNIKNEDFTWDTNFNLTFQKAIIKELPNGDDIQYGDGDMYLHREDESMYTFYLPEWKGVNPETGLGEFWKDPNDHSKGVVNYYDEAGKGIVGKAIPDVMGGMTNSFTYKDFDLSFLITYQFGGDIFDYPNYFFRHDGFRLGSMNLEKSVAGDYWMNPGDNVSYPKPIYANPYRSDRFSSRHIVSSDNIRMREITFGYNIPVWKNIFSNLRVYFRANNPFMIWQKTKGIDPDVPLNGYRQVDTPVSKSFVFGVNITL